MGKGTRVPQKDLMILAAFSHSRSSVAGQNASFCTRPGCPAFAAATFTLAKALDTLAVVLVLDLFPAPQPKKPPAPTLEPNEEERFSHEGRKAETRCMLGGVGKLEKEEGRLSDCKSLRHRPFLVACPERRRSEKKNGERGVKRKGEEDGDCCSRG